MRTFSCKSKKKISYLKHVSYFLLFLPIVFVNKRPKLNSAQGLYFLYIKSNVAEIL